jgi:hypothetical protein
MTSGSSILAMTRSCGRSHRARFCVPDRFAAAFGRANRQSCRFVDVDKVN